MVKSSLLFGAIGLAGGKMEWTDSAANYQAVVILINVGLATLTEAFTGGMF